MVTNIRQSLRLGFVVGLAAIIATGCSTNTNSSSAVSSQSQQEQTSQISSVQETESSQQEPSEQTSISSQSQVTATHSLTTETVNQFNFGSYITQEGENIDPLRGENGHFYFHTVSPIHGLTLGLTRTLYDLNCETGEISELITFSDDEQIRICDFIKYQNSQLEMRYQFFGENCKFLIQKDGEEIFSAVSVDMLSLPKFTVVGDNLFFQINEMGLNNSISGNVYRVNPGFSVDSIYSSPIPIKGLINTFNYSGNYAIGIQDADSERFGILNNQDEFTFVETSNDENIYPLTTGFIHCKQIGENTYSMFWIDKDTQNEIDLGQTFEGVMGNYTALENNMFMYEDLNQQSYIGCFENNQVRIEPLNAVTSGFCRYAQTSSNSQLIYFNAIDTNDIGQIVAQSWGGILVKQQ